MEKKSFVVIRAGWDPMPSATKHHRWLDCEEILHAYGLETHQDLLIMWRKRTAELPPMERCLVLGPRMPWAYAVPECAVEILRNRLNWDMQRAINKAWKNTKGGKVAIVNGKEV